MAVLKYFLVFGCLGMFCIEASAKVIAKAVPYSAGSKDCTLKLTENGAPVTLTGGNILTMLQMKPSSDKLIKSYFGIPKDRDTAAAIMQTVVLRANADFGGRKITEVSKQTQRLLGCQDSVNFSPNIDTEDSAARISCEMTSKIAAELNSTVFSGDFVAQPKIIESCIGKSDVLECSKNRPAKKASSSASGVQ